MSMALKDCFDSCRKRIRSHDRVSTGSSVAINTFCRLRGASYSATAQPRRTNPLLVVVLGLVEILDSVCRSDGPRQPSACARRAANVRTGLFRDAAGSAAFLRTNVGAVWSRCDGAAFNPPPARALEHWVAAILARWLVRWVPQMFIMSCLNAAGRNGTSHLSLQTGRFKACSGIGYLDYFMISGKQGPNSGRRGK